jgi:hypothetical protein
MPVALRQPPRASAPRPSLCDGRPCAEGAPALWWTVRQHALHGRRRDWRAKAAQQQRWPRVTRRQSTRWRAQWPLSRGPGRPPRAAAAGSMRCGPAVVWVTPRLPCVGVPLVACGLDHHEAFEPVVAGRHEAISAPHRPHPGADCAVVHHRAAPLRRRVHARGLAPL